MNNHVSNMPTTQPATSPAEPGVWLFVFADMCIFALYFAVFAWEKSLHQSSFAESQATLNTLFGGLNTVILLVSSYFMATAVQAARSNKPSLFSRSLNITALCGLAFLIVKAFEYTEKFNAGITIYTNEFYRNYFAFTGFHMVHVIIGLSLLLYMMYFSGNQQDRIESDIKTVEGVGLYWHMVDLLWVVLFALIYLVP